jgi:hypothetical protein
MFDFTSPPLSVAMSFSVLFAIYGNFLALLGFVGGYGFFMGLVNSRATSWLYSSILSSTLHFKGLVYSLSLSIA